VEIAHYVDALESAGVVFVVGEGEIRAEANLEALRPEELDALQALQTCSGDLMVYLCARTDGLPPADRYSSALLATLRRTAANSGSCPTLLPWLRERQPHLYTAITERIPHRLQALWENHGPVEEFDVALRELEELRFRAAGFFVASNRELLRNKDA
jgi:hypothetical protein